MWVRACVGVINGCVLVCVGACVRACGMAPCVCVSMYACMECALVITDK